MVSRDEKIGVAHWVDNILVSLPLHLKIYLSGQNSLQLNRYRPPTISLLCSATVTGHAVDRNSSVVLVFFDANKTKRRTHVAWYATEMELI